jgi:hypothetical protein
MRVASAQLEAVEHLARAMPERLRGFLPAHKQA